MLKSSNLQTVFDFIEPFKSYDDSKNRILHIIKLSIFLVFRTFLLKQSSQNYNKPVISVYDY
jgi:hypothetical protein